MQAEVFEVKNVKCNGCAGNIRQNISKLPGVTEVTVEIASGRVTVTGEALVRADIAARLGSLGYPVVA